MQAIFDMENIYLEAKMIKKNHYTKTHVQELDDTKNVNTKSMIIGK